MNTKHRVLSCLLLFLFIFGCAADAKDLIEVVMDPPSRETIDRSRVGINNFFADSTFGTTREQFLEMRDTLGVNYVRVLFAWTDGVQDSYNGDRFYGFYDEIVENIPAGMDVMVVLAHAPSWISSLSASEARNAFVEQWVRPTVERYAGTPGIVGWQIWNEPDNPVGVSDATLVLTDPANYFELLKAGSEVVHSVDPGKLVITAASRSIQQNGKANLNYNKDLRDLGAEEYADVWAIHYYGEQYEKVVDGVDDFLNGLSLPIWLTESGQQGPNNQLAYVETAWPFLIEKVPGIARTYYYQFAEDTAIDANYGLRTTDPSFPVSDLYVYLRDN